MCRSQIPQELQPSALRLYYHSILAILNCLPRLKAVVDGEQGGISKSVNWQGGSGFKFYELAPTLVVKDKHGQPIISEKYSPEMLVAAVAKLNGFNYAPVEDIYWKQGKGNQYEHDNKIELSEEKA